MFVVTADQDNSRGTSDLVPELLKAMSEYTASLDGIAQPFERTVGDEVQAVISTAGSALAIALELQRLREWSVGLGIGMVNLPLADSARASSGEAFICARDAVERASSRTVPVPIAVSGPEAASVAECEALLQLLASVVRRRSPAGWEAVDLVRGGADTYKDVARTLGISPQAVSERLRVAQWDEEQAVHPLAVRLLADLDTATAG